MQVCGEQAQSSMSATLDPGIQGLQGCDGQTTAISHIHIYIYIFMYSILLITILWLKVFPEI